jgi:hypothetical protein
MKKLISQSQIRIPMKWKSRKRQIDKLLAKHGRGSWKVPFPNLSVDKDVPKTSDRITGFSYSKPLPSDAKTFPVGHSHKQGLQLITPGQLENEMEWMGGKKS